VTDTGLGGIVRSLELGNVDDVTAHGGSGDKAPIGEVLEFVAEQVGALLLLSSPVGSSSTSAVPGGIKIGLDNVQVVLDGAINRGTLSPWNTCIGNEDIQAAIKVLNSLIDGSFGFLLIAQVALICLG
jgi:hypothetical protein